MNYIKDLFFHMKLFRLLNVKLVPLPRFWGFPTSLTHINDTMTQIHVDSAVVLDKPVCDLWDFMSHLVSLGTSVMVIVEILSPSTIWLLFSCSRNAKKAKLCRGESN